MNAISNISAVPEALFDVELIALSDEFNAKFAVFHAAEEEEASNAAAAAYWVILNKITAAPARSYVGLAIKSRIALDYGAHDGALGDFLDSLMADCIRLAGGVASAPSDAELIRLCEQHVANHDALNACPLDSDESPHWPPYEATRDAITEARPMTLEGLVAKARAAKVEAMMPNGKEIYDGGRPVVWAWDLVNDLLRLAGGAA